MLSKYKFTDKEKKELISSVTILLDTREKKNEHIIKTLEKKNIPFKKKKLDYGDYSFMIPANEALGIQRDLWFDKEIIVERKASLEELSGNLTQSRSRFQEEMALAPKNKVLMIENNSYEDIVLHNYNTEYSEKSYLSTLHSFWWRYNCPFFFVKEDDIVVFIWYWFVSFLKESLR